MLELKDITKEYRTGDEVVHALKGVSVRFRESEFVAILGQSGCGKTTLLNIIGGLDQYTSGDLVINGVSTKEYKTKDWGRLPQPQCRLCVPELQPYPSSDGTFERGVGAHLVRRLEGRTTQARHGSTPGGRPGRPAAQKNRAKCPAARCSASP